ncbi:unnamed protein product [Fusarium graminearum]|uniref:Amino acid transporter transmembrane domain-containing protein n=1 Tax=Gibberella zeae TaxID=5518 RepID=A0A679NSF5_GIBZA|nr:hypothetical protein HG531_008370 [Fusarium graminearum]CAG2002092.1 unnamed protein product [Fusarium graminearum]CZS74907.1 unnamed protein product [Fusarium graminearum]
MELNTLNAEQNDRTQPDNTRNGTPNNSRYTNRRELTEPREAPVPHGSLKFYDVASLIVNKMVGTGIFIAPASVFLLTGNRIVTVCLFTVGFLYTIVSMVIYLNYAKVLPFNGGELVYIDEITSGGRIGRFFGDGLLAYIIYAIAFMVFFNSSTNAMQVGQMILVLADPDSDKVNVNGYIMRIIGVACLVLICLLQYFSPRSGRLVNLLTALGKILMLIGIVTVGSIAVSGVETSTNWNENHKVEDSSSYETGVSMAKALLTVIFSFEGWENATFVAGEVGAHNYSTLRNGFLLAVITVGALYMVIVGLFLHAVQWAQLVPGKNDDSVKTIINYVPLFTKGTDAPRLAWAAVTAISALGSLNAIIYTFSRVKQAIGQADVLPWSCYWKKDDRIERSDKGYYNKSPQGGLLIHCLMSVALIIVTISIRDTAESVGLLVNDKVDVHADICAAFLGLAFFNLHNREISLWPNEGSVHRRNISQGWKYILYPIVVVYVILNVAILVITVLPPYKTVGGSSKNAVPGWIFISLTGLVLLVGTTYYFLFFGALRRTYRTLPREPENIDGRGNWNNPQVEGETAEVVNGILNYGSIWNWMRWARVKCEMIKDDHYTEGIPRIYRFGRRWRLVYSLPGDVAEENEVGQGSGLQPNAGWLNLPDYLYWLFGGRRLQRLPWERSKEVQNLPRSG